MKKIEAVFSTGVAPRPPKAKALMSNAPLLTSQVTRIDTQPCPCCSLVAQGAFEVAHRQPGAGDSLWTTALPE